MTERSGRSPSAGRPRRSPGIVAQVDQVVRERGDPEVAEEITEVVGRLGRPGVVGEVDDLVAREGYGPHPLTEAEPSPAREDPEP